MPNQPPTALAGHQPTPGWDHAIKQAEIAIATPKGPRTAMTGLGRSDPFARLPPLAARKLRDLQSENEELAMIADGEFNLRQSLIQDRMKAKARLDNLTDRAAWVRAGSNGDFPKPTDHVVIKAHADYDSLSARLENLTAKQKARQSRHIAIANLLRRVESYLNSNAGALVPFALDPSPQLPPGELPINAVERMRQKRRELVFDMRSVEAAPRHSSVVKEMIRSEVAALAERGQPDVYRLIEGGSKIQWPEISHSAQLSGFAASEGKTHTLYGTAFGNISDSLPLLCFLFKDRVIDALEAEADEAADDENALSPEEKTERIAAISAELLTCERLEEAFIELADGAIVRRPDTDPRAFLGVDGPAPRGE